jgi:hypothetical protein
MAILGIAAGIYFGRRKGKGQALAKAQARAQAAAAGGAAVSGVDVGGVHVHVHLDGGGESVDDGEAVALLRAIVGERASNNVVQLDAGRNGELRGAPAAALPAGGVVDGLGAGAYGGVRSARDERVASVNRHPSNGELVAMEMEDRRRIVELLGREPGA